MTNSVNMNKEIEEHGHELKVEMMTPRFPDLGVSGIPDQYADGKAAQVWRLYVGGSSSRTENYKDWLIGKLKEHNVSTICDAACGTGIDSLMLCENGFKLQSYDASDKMLKFALQHRWERREESGFSDWVIEEANWLTMAKTIAIPTGGFDACICLGNSFAHLLDEEDNGHIHLQAIENFFNVLKPGGVLIIDIRNYDAILNSGTAPAHNIYYSSTRIDKLRTSVIRTDGFYRQVTLDYRVDVSDNADKSEFEQFRLSYYPHTRNGFLAKLKNIFGDKAKIDILGDYKPIDDNGPDPGYWIFTCVKQ